jgi:8-oxo-dGTP diphosphatase
MIEGQRDKIKPCVGVMVFKDGKILLGKRRGSHGSGEYSMSGGHLEYDESFEDCAKRETEEESNIKIKNIKFQCLANYTKHENRQDILVGMIADFESGELVDFPEERIGEWGWYDLKNLPSPLLYPSEIVIDSYKKDKNFYDKE